MSESNDRKIVFKKKSRFGQRRRRLSDEETEEVVSEVSNDWNKLNELKQIQNQRKRNTKGINILELTQNPITNTNTNNSNNNTNNNNINNNESKSGGLSDAKTLSNELDLGNTFSVETNRRDEDTDLMKYIEEELNKRKGTQTSRNSSNADPNQALVKTSNDINSLFDVLPEHLIANSAKKSEEMLSNQMLNGIPEVELGLDEKIRNIEATEDAKTRLMEIRNNRSNQNTSSFVPNNIAVCFVQHNRFNIGEDVQRLNQNTKRLRTESQQPNTYVEEPVVVIGDEPKQLIKLQNKNSEQHQKGFYGKDKASDDYIFEKFKKQFRKF